MSDGETVAVPKALLEKLLDRVDELEAELQEYRAENEKDKATIRQKVAAAVAESERSDDDGEEDEAESMLPIERLAKFGEDHTVIGDVTASVKRATTIFTHFREWSVKTPSGRVIKENLKTLLNTALDETITWKQVYRACKKLETWSKGAIQFEKHRRHGWMLVANSDWRASSAATG